MKKLFILVMVGLGLTILFNACDNTAESTLSASQVESNVTATVAENVSCAPLNLVPEEVASKMDKEELALWKKMSTHFFINYDFLHTSYYKNNKKAFLKRMERLYERAKKEGKPAQLFFITESELPKFSINKKKGISLAYDPTDPIPSDTGDIGREFDIETPFNCSYTIYLDNYNIIFHVTGTCAAKGTPENFECEWTGLSYFFEPSGVYFSGYMNLTPKGNEVHIEGKGNISYRSHRIYFAPNFYIGFIPDNGVTMTN